MKISYVIPVYQNEGSIERTWEAIVSLFSSGLAGYDYEILFVNDGSKDRSATEMEEVAAKDPKVRLIQFTRNFGQIAAIVAGYEHATGDAIINMSADLQDPAELTVDMVRAWRAGSHVVVGHRADREDSMMARMLSKLAYGALRVSNPNIPEGGFDFVLLSRYALDIFLTFKGRNRFFQGDVLWSGLPATFIPYVRRKRTIGKSQYNFSKKLKLFYDFLLDGSYLPIRIMSVCGVLSSVLGLSYAALIIVLRLIGDVPFQGWAPIMVVVLVIGGMIMFMLSLIGEYLWRILDEIKAKPLYIIKSDGTGNDKRQD
ncbi:glycosyltransferase family 2 protein [Frateuria edaphi]|uniref:glycosyltransferase family 2 protein n=1 Tax=Frateuria edaphi TaxID=2898793 RepID=UPI001E426864|nr:glycosyltransferase family 2 protein [Frateuria edaphi]UGB44992.1 glycosyltransferase family 2 protein [Frateuria edaphi]